jgi:hypothetical protein
MGFICETPDFPEFKVGIYTIIPNSMVYQDAKDHCRSYPGRDLAVIKNAEENQALLDAVSSVGSYNIWIGLEGVGLDGHQNGVWIDGSAPEYTNWNAGEPNDAGGIEHCSEFHGSDGRWNDLPCTERKSFVCVEVAVSERSGSPSPSPSPAPQCEDHDEIINALAVVAGAEIDGCNDIQRLGFCNSPYGPFAKLFCPVSCRVTDKDATIASLAARVILESPPTSCREVLQLTSCFDETYGKHIRRLCPCSCNQQVLSFVNPSSS